MDKFEKTLRKNWVICLLAMICCLLWGSAFPCVKIGYRLFEIGASDTGSQILFAGTRFTLAGILTIAIGSVVGRKILVPEKGSWHMVFKLCLVQTVIQYLLFYIGLANTTGVKSSIIEAANVFFAILASSLLFHYEKLGKKKIAGCILGFAGVVLINLNGTGFDTSMSFLGEGCILLSTVSYAFSSVLIKKYSQKENPVTLSGYQFTAGGLVMAAAGAVMGGRLQGFSAASVGLLVYMAMISAVAYSLWGILLKYNPVGKVAVYGFMNPVFGVILSALLLGEQNQAFTVQGLISLILVCFGIYAVNRE
ncbi:MAG: DMT family transporter [Eubacteriales bacterium]|nr:DMT family transporter [Eubacteriales bacterium]